MHTKRAGLLHRSLVAMEGAALAAGNTGFAYNCSTVEAHGYALAEGIHPSLAVSICMDIYLGRAGLPVLLTIRIILE